MHALTRWDTGKETMSQPDVWAAWAPELDGVAAEIRGWIAERQPHEIWLSGAGTSSFIGMSLERRLSKLSARSVRAISSTDLVATPYEFFEPGLRPLVVSFGRSGNSSESVGVLDLLDNFCPEADRLNITCNGDSALANRTRTAPEKSRVIVLPETTHDAGFAMTASYSTMLYTALACLGPENRLGEMAEAAQDVLSRGLQTFNLQECPERIVFLGAGPLKAAARESSLKILELTKGRVATLWDSPLGFRHGPKSFVNERTKVVLFKSAHGLTRAYDDDLEAELRTQFGSKIVTSLGNTEAKADAVLPLSNDDTWNVPVCVIPAQIAGIVWADAMGINVDNPFMGDGNLTRVVSGVRLHTNKDW